MRRKPIERHQTLREKIAGMRTQLFESLTGQFAKELDRSVARIREAFIPVLTAIFHVRTPYPTPPEDRRRSRADADARKEAS